MKPKISWTVSDKVDQDTGAVLSYWDEKSHRSVAVYAEVELLINGVGHMRDFCLNDWKSIQSCKMGTLRALRCRVATFPNEYQNNGIDTEQLLQVAWL